MTVKDLKEQLNQFPDDMEVFIKYYNDYDGEEDSLARVLQVYNSIVNHCTYIDWRSNNVEYISLKNDTCVYRDMNRLGNFIDVKLPTNKKEVVILDF